MRHKCEPCLEYDGDYSSPVEQQARRKVIFHVMPVDVIHNEWECMQKSQDKEGISNPSMKHLELFVRHSGHQGNPIGLGCSCAIYCQCNLTRAIAMGTDNTKGMHPSASQPDLVASGGEPPNFSSDQ
jgi:hypothetical protein